MHSIYTHIHIIWYVWCIYEIYTNCGISGTSWTRSRQIPQNTPNNWNITMGVAIAADNGQCKSILWQRLLVISYPGCSCPAEFTSTFGPDFAVNSHANSPSGHSRRWCSAASTDVDYGRYSKRHKRLCGETNVAFMRITIPL